MQKPEIDGENLLGMGELYNLLARSFTSDGAELERVLADISPVLKSANMTHVVPLLKRLESVLKEPDATEGYVKLFEMGTAAPYETSYTCKEHPYRKTFEEADISGFYKAFGMKPRGDLPDHIAVELEFIALLYVKEGYALLLGDSSNEVLCREAREKFLKEHLSKWVGDFKSEVLKQANKQLYPLILQLIDSVVSSSSKKNSQQK